MIVRYLDKIENSERTVKADTWASTRMLLQNDGMGFSFHITTIFAGTETPIWYQNHLESVYCIEGEGEIETLDDNQTYKICPGMIYALNKNDRHILKAHSDLKLACVFNPALHGKEVHNQDGVYPLEAEPIND